MSGKAAIKGISRSDEYVVSFKKEPDGTYTKQTKRLTRDHTTNTVKHYKRGNPIVEEGPFTLVSAASGYDDKMALEDFNGDMAFLYFKKVQSHE